MNVFQIDEKSEEEQTEIINTFQLVMLIMAIIIIAQFFLIAYYIQKYKKQMQIIKKQEQYQQNEKSDKKRLEIPEKDSENEKFEQHIQIQQVPQVQQNHEKNEKNDKIDKSQEILEKQIEDLRHINQNLTENLDRLKNDQQGDQLQKQVENLQIANNNLQQNIEKQKQAYQILLQQMIDIQKSSKDHKNKNEKQRINQDIQTDEQQSFSEKDCKKCIKFKDLQIQKQQDVLKIELLSHQKESLLAEIKTIKKDHDELAKLIEKYKEISYKNQQKNIEKIKNEHKQVIHQNYIENKQKDTEMIKYKQQKDELQVNFRLILAKNVAFKLFLQIFSFLHTFFQEINQDMEYKLYQVRQQYLQEKQILEKEQYELQQNQKEQCVICLDKASEILIKPCNHLCFCIQCSKDYNQDLCPKCRMKIEGKIKIF